MTDTEPRKATGTPIRELFDETNRIKALETRITALEEGLASALETLLQTNLAGRMTAQAGLIVCENVRELTGRVRALEQTR